MKSVILLILSFLFCVNSMADGLYIPLYPKEESATREQRSLEMVPIAMLEGNWICIYSEKTLENVCIRVTDANGNVVASEDVDEIQGRYTFYIEDTEVKGTLTLFIQTATESYEGIFSLE